MTSELEARIATFQQQACEAVAHTVNNRDLLARLEEEVEGCRQVGIEACTREQQVKEQLH